MVGVPGRSKGCATCRRRRKGCDLQKPVCGQCKKSKLACAGWTRERVFVNATQSQSVMQYNTGLANVTHEPVVLDPTLATSAYQEKYLGMFWDLCQPPDDASEGGVLRAYAADNWTAVARDLYYNCPTVRTTLIAHCLATIGRCENKRELMVESLKYYTVALGKVRSDLLHAKRSLGDAVIVASRALASYEILYGQEHGHGPAHANQAKSWQAYNLGDECLVLRRGPEMHRRGIGFRLFVDGRMPLLITATLRRKRTFLAEEAWKTIPWREQEKTARDRLLDVAADVPGLLQELDEFCDWRTSDRLDSLLQNLEQVGAELTHWFETEAPISHVEEIQSRGFEAATKGDIAVVEVMTVYWTMCLLTYSALYIIIHLRPDLPMSSPAIAKLMSLPRSYPRWYCTLIADTVGVFFQPHAGGMFAKSAAFPIGVSLGYFMSTEGLDSREAKLLLGYLTAGNQGKAMGAFIKGSVQEWGPNFPKTRMGSQSMAEGRFLSVESYDVLKGQTELVM